MHIILRMSYAKYYIKLNMHSKQKLKKIPRYIRKFLIQT